MKFWKVMFLLVTITAITACRKPSDEEIYYKAHKKMMEINSYQTVAKVLSYTGDSVREYKFNQIFQYPNKYRLEAISPSNLEGNITIFSGEAALIKHTSINQTWKIENVKQSKEQTMFIGYFLKSFTNSENSSYNKESLNGQNSIVITTELPGGNPHFYKQKLWISYDNFTPFKLNIIDEQENVKFEVYFEDFKLNPKLDEKLFYID